MVPVDLWTASRLEEVIRRIVAAVPWTWSWKDRLQALWLGAGLSLGVRADAQGDPTFTVTSAAGEIGGARARELLLGVIARLDAVAREAGSPVALILDEFQRMEELDRGAAALLRSAIQQSHSLAFVCAGSTESVVDALVGPAGPLHGVFEQLTVGPIEAEHLSVWIEDRLRSRAVIPAAGTGAAILSWAGRRTEDALRLAREVFEAGAHSGRTSPADVPRAVRTIVLDRRATYERVWVELAESQRNVLRALASDAVQLTSRDTIRQFGLPTPAAVKKALGRLKERHLVTWRDGEIADPFFREWILMDAMPDGVPRGGS